MRKLLIQSLCLAGLATAPIEAQSTEYEPFIPSNGGTYPKVSTLLAVEEGAINKILRDDFVKKFRFTTGTTLLDRTVRVGDVLEGHFTVTNPGMSEFTFGINRLAVDVQRTPPPQAQSKMLIRMGFSLSIGTVFVRNYDYEWVINGVYDYGAERPVILLDRDVVMDLRSDVQALGGIGITKEHICQAIPGLGAAACQEYESKIIGKLQTALSYLPLIRDYASKSIDLSAARAQAEAYYQTISPCRMYEKVTPVTSCPSQLVSLETAALQRFKEMTYALERTGDADLEAAAIGAWESAMAAPKNWLTGCAMNPLTTQGARCFKALANFTLADGNIGNYETIGEIYGNARDLVDQVMALMSEEGRRVGHSALYLSNGKLFGALANDRVLIGASVDIKWITPSVTFEYDQPSGIITITSNIGFRVPALTPVGGWTSSYLKSVPITHAVVVSPLAYSRNLDRYVMKLNLKTAFLNALHKAWEEDGFCIATGCPEPTASNTVGWEHYITVWTDVGLTLENVHTAFVKL